MRWGFSKWRACWQELISKLAFAAVIRLLQSLGCCILRLDARSNPEQTGNLTRVLVKKTAISVGPHFRFRACLGHSIHQPEPTYRWFALRNDFMWVVAFGTQRFLSSLKWMKPDAPVANVLWRRFLRQCGFPNRTRREKWRQGFGDMVPLP